MRAKRVRHYRKYANRKFYDEERGAYASVSQIANVVKRGDSVSMTCDRTGRDLTLEILARVLYEEVRKTGKSAEPVAGGAGRGQQDAVSPDEVASLVRRVGRA